MRIGVHLLTFDFSDGPESVAPTLAKVASAAEAPGPRSCIETLLL